jgi:ABC-2 type transport system permease protein
MTLPRALSAEWTKLRTVRSTTWSIAAVVGLTIALTAFLCSLAQTDAGGVGEGDDDIVANSLFGVHLGLIAVVAFAALVVASEYRTGAIRTTFAAMPGRGAVLGAKALLVSILVFASGLVASTASFLIGQPLLHGGNFVPPAYPYVSLTDPPVVRAVVGTAMFLTAVALLALGVATILRRSAAAIATVLGLLLVPVVVSDALQERTRELVRELTPIAGVAIQTTRERFDNLPIGPWGGLAVTGAWAAAAMAVAAWTLRTRDA